MKLTKTLSKIFVSIFAFTGISSEYANAAVVISFSEIGGNVVASCSGSFTIPTSASGSFSGTAFAGSSSELYRFDGDWTRYSGGTGVSSGLLVAPSISADSAFGYSGTFFYAPNSQAPNSVYTPNTTWTWSSTNVNTLFPGGLSSTPSVVYTASNQDTISFARAVPEPSSMLVFAASIGFLSIFRRKKR
jgi:PEP-CTERM motif